MQALLYGHIGEGGEAEARIKIVNSCWPALSPPRFTQKKGTRAVLP